VGPLISHSDRYIGRQVLFATIFGVIVLSLIFVLGNLFKQIFELLVDRNLPINSVLQFILYILPYSLIFTIPWSLLTGVLLVFGRLSADNELVSFRMSGMSMFRICRPVFLIAVGLVFLSFLINTQIAPRGKAAMKETLYNMAIDDPLALIVPDKAIYQFPNYRIYADSRNGNRLLGLEVVELDENKSPIRYIRAMEAGVEYDEAEDQLLLLLNNAEGVIKNEKDPTDFDNLLPGISAEKTTIPLDLSSFRNNPKKLKPSNLDTSELRRRLSGDEPISEKKKNEIRTEIQKRHSFAVACFAFALIGIPLGVVSQRSETTSGFAVSMVVAFLYFLGIIYADNRDSDAIAPLLMWVPTAIMILIGGILFFRLNRK